MSYLTRLKFWARHIGVRKLLGHAQNLMKGWVWRQGGRMWRRTRARWKGKAIVRL